MDEKKPVKLFPYLKAFLIIALVLYFFTSIRRINNRLESVNQTKEVRVGEARIKGVSASVSVPGYTDTEGGAAKSVIDGSPTTWWYGPTGKDPISLTLEFPTQMLVGEVDITFIDGRQSTDYAIYLKDGDSWVTAKDVIGNKDQYVQEVIDSTKTISTKDVKLSFYRTVAADGLLGVAEVKVFKKL